MTDMNIPNQFKLEVSLDWYKCDRCGCNKRKLFRDHGFFLWKVDVLCLDCLAQELHRDKRDILSSILKNGTTSWYGPAIPCQGGSFYAFGAPPREYVLWWAALRNDPDESVVDYINFYHAMYNRIHVDITDLPPEIRLFLESEFRNKKNDAD